MRFCFLGHHTNSINNVIVLIVLILLLAVVIVLVVLIGAVGYSWLLEYVLITVCLGISCEYNGLASIIYFTYLTIAHVLHSWFFRPSNSFKMRSPPLSRVSPRPSWLAFFVFSRFNSCFVCRSRSVLLSEVSHVVYLYTLRCAGRVAGLSSRRLWVNPWACFCFRGFAPIPFLYLLYIYR